MSDKATTGGKATRPGADENLKERYWLQDPLSLPDKISAAVAQSPSRGAAYTIGHTFSGRPIPGVRFGSGPHSLLIVGAMHGWETITTYSEYALIDTLFSGRGIDGEDLREWVAEVAEKQTIHVVPQVSIDVAERMHRVVPEGYFPNLVGMESEEDRDFYAQILGDPYFYYTGTKVAGRFHGFTPEQVAEWRGMGNELGLRWSDQGIDIWCDFEKFATPEARAVRDHTSRVKPHCVLEMHGYEGPLFVTAPTPLTPPHLVDRAVHFAREMLAAHRATGIPMIDEPSNPYIVAEQPFYPNWVDREIGALMLFGELQMYRNRWYETTSSKRRTEEEYDAAWMPTQGQIIRSGWTIYKRLIELGQTDGYLPN